MEELPGEDLQQTCATVENLLDNKDGRHSTMAMSAMGKEMDCRDPGLL
jgi:hypothetical protein